MKLATVAVLLGVALSAVGCTPLTEIRTKHVSTPVMKPKSEDALLADCVPGHPAHAEITNSIEVYEDYLVGFVEFDDQGWHYDKGKQMQALLGRMRSELDNPNYIDYGIVVLVFVHGWHHNAYDNDCNVNQFRAMVKLTSDRLKEKNAKLSSPDNRPQRVIGVYVGWRGEALNAPVLRYASIFDRRFAAEHVAKGSVRELFAELRKLQYNYLKDKSAKPDSRIRTIVIGHSFGGLIAYHSLAQALLNDIVLTRRDAAFGCKPVAGPLLWPNQIILINPAFEASRVEAIHNAAKEDPNCDFENADPSTMTRPKLLVLTAKNDAATGTIFPIFRFVSTLFEKYTTSPETRQDEREANLHAIGFVDRYRTHRLCLSKDGLAVLPDEPRTGPTTKIDSNSPVWVVTATPDIIDGHDGFLFARDRASKPTPYLLNWLLNGYLNHYYPRGQCNS